MKQETWSRRICLCFSQSDICQGLAPPALKNILRDANLRNLPPNQLFPYPILPYCFKSKSCGPQSPSKQRAVRASSSIKISEGPQVQGITLKVTLPIPVGRTATITQPRSFLPEDQYMELLVYAAASEFLAPFLLGGMKLRRSSEKQAVSVMAPMSPRK